MAMSGQVTRFLGDSPLRVALRLLVLSLLVGCLLAWLDLRPADLLDWVVDVGRWAWESLFGSLGRAADYVLLGAAVVVPLFLISRFLKLGRN